MRAIMTAKLCAASAVGGGVLTPPVTRAAKKQAAKLLRRGARGYIKVRERAVSTAEATGWPGQIAATSAALTLHVAQDALDRWRELVIEVEKETAAERVAAPEPVMTMEEYMASPG